MTPTRACLWRIRVRSVAMCVVLMGWKLAGPRPADDRRLPCGQPVDEPGRGGHAIEIGIDHHRDQPGEIDGRFPSELAARFGAVADEMLDLSRTNQPRIEPDVLPPVEADMAEGDLDELANRMRDAGGDDEIVRLSLLQHQPHRPDVVGRIAPVSAR